MNPGMTVYTSKYEYNYICISEDSFYRSKQRSRIMGHFIWVDTVCQSAHIVVTSMQRVYIVNWLILRPKEAFEDV